MKERFVIGPTHVHQEFLTDTATDVIQVIAEQAAPQGAVPGTIEVDRVFVDPSDDNRVLLRIHGRAERLRTRFLPSQPPVDPARTATLRRPTRRYSG